jgi:hypothetical protein
MRYLTLNFKNTWMYIGFVRLEFLTLNPGLTHYVPGVPDGCRTRPQSMDAKGSRG